MFKSTEINYLWFLGGKFNVWFINDDPGNGENGGILTPQNKPCPNMATAFKIYDESSKVWKSAPDLKFECVNDPTPKWATWSNWSDCEVSCRVESENYTVSRTRICENGDTCKGEHIEEKPCAENICEWSEWSDWIKGNNCYFCNAPDANESRNRNCPREGKCKGDDAENKPCDNKCKTECCDKYSGRCDGEDHAMGELPVTQD